MTGVSIVDVGVTRVSGSGRVTGLRNVAGGGSVSVLRNQNGVTIDNVSTAQGARLERDRLNLKRSLNFADSYRIPLG